VAGLEVRLPVEVAELVAPLLDLLHLIGLPDVEVDALDCKWGSRGCQARLRDARASGDGRTLGDVRAHATMDARAADADKDAEVPGGPSGVWTSSSG